MEHSEPARSWKPLSPPYRGHSVSHPPARAWLEASPDLRLPPRPQTTAFGNCGALPFVLLLPIVRQWPVTRDDPKAQETGLAAIGVSCCAAF